MSDIDPMLASFILNSVRFFTNARQIYILILDPYPFLGSYLCQILTYVRIFSNSVRFWYLSDSDPI